MIQIIILLTIRKYDNAPLPPPQKGGKKEKKLAIIVNIYMWISRKNLCIKSVIVHRSHYNKANIFVWVALNGLII